MPYFKLTEAELRETTKKYLELLEFWLRRLVNDKLTEVYGENYWDYKCEKNIYILKNSLRNTVSERYNKNPERFSRWIDATLLEHVIDIVCKDILYRDIFKPCFDYNFNGDRENLRKTLLILRDIRNILYHGNPISIRQAERAVCYSRDIVESIQDYYKMQKREQQFNVPLILSYSDSLGNKLNREQIRWSTNTLVIDLSESVLYSGDTIRLEIEVDPSFDDSEYSILWRWKDMPDNIDLTKNTITIELTNKQVGELFVVNVKIISNKDWHKLNGCDDTLAIRFVVIPKS